MDFSALFSTISPELISELTTQLAEFGAQPVQIELVLSVLLGVAVSASCGFRVFLPPLVISVASMFFGIDLPTGLSWMGTYPAMLIFLTASVVEVFAYYLPWVDHLLDGLTAPAAVIAGTILTSSFIGNSLEPMMQWTVALIAGGGAAGAVQATKSTGRAASTAVTLGFGNSVFSTFETVAALIVPIVSLVFPVMSVVIGLLALVLTVLMAVLLFFLWTRRKKKPTVVSQPA